jgi:hypothetical protein
MAVIIPSSEIPARWRVFKESVKVCTPKSPTPADKASLDLSASYVFAHCPVAQPQHFRRLTECEKVLSNRFRRGLFFIRHGLLPYQ